LKATDSATLSNSDLSILAGNIGSSLKSTAAAGATDPKVLLTNGPCTASTD